LAEIQRMMAVLVGKRSILAKKLELRYDFGT
jgi:hypothetical protein